MAFVDEARIFVKAGDGGKGCESFHRDRSNRHPRPDGGDGGKGGDIVFVADTHVQTLLDFKYRQHFKAKNGGHASSRGKTGRNGQESVLRVPVGTIIRDENNNLLIKDLVEPGQRVIVARGGRGGIGNENKKTPQPPQSGEERTLFLELKIIADVGLVGFPNAGKSTIICAISKVKSKIANYPFTTKQPILGIVEGDFDEIDFVVADLPGLIEGAHGGRGLGDKFLKHVERTRILGHVIDMAGTEGRDPYDDFMTISSELEQYSDQLSLKKRVIIANKMDVPEAADNLKNFKKKCKDEVIEVSAVEKQGLDLLVAKLRNVLCQENSQEK